MRFVPPSPLWERRPQPAQRFDSMTQPRTEGRNPVKPATRQQTGRNRPGTGSAAMTDTPFRHLTSRLLSRSLTTQNASTPERRPQQDDERMQNKQRTGHGQALNRPSRHQLIGGAPPPPAHKLELGPFCRASYSYSYSCSYSVPHPVGAHAGTASEQAPNKPRTGSPRTTTLPSSPGFPQPASAGFFRVDRGFSPWPLV